MEGYGTACPIRRSSTWDTGGAWEVFSIEKQELGSRREGEGESSDEIERERSGEGKIRNFGEGDRAGGRSGRRGSGAWGGQYKGGDVAVCLSGKVLFFLNSANCCLFHISNTKYKDSCVERFDLSQLSVYISMC